jgi:hypothetical protein
MFAHAFLHVNGKLKHKMEGVITAGAIAELTKPFFFDGPLPAFAQQKVPNV